MAKTKTYNTKVYYGPVGGEEGPSTSLGVLVDIKPPKPRRDAIDGYTLESADDAKEYLAGTMEGGEFSMTLEFDKDKVSEVYGIEGQDKDFKILFSNGSYWTCSGFIQEFGNDAETGKLVRTTASVKVSGKPVFTK